MWQRILMILLTFALASACAAQEDSRNLELVGKTPGGLCANDVFALDNYAYLCAEPGLVILNISDPSNPIEVGQAYVPIVAYAIYVSGGYAYMVGDELRVIDISNPAAPQEVGICGTSGYAQGVHVSGDYAYVADSADGLRLVDISNPSNPQEVGGCDTPRYAQGVYVSGSYAYVADREGGLRVIDISDPSNPQEVGFYSRPGEINEAMGVHVSGDYAYVAYGVANLGFFAGILDAGGASLGVPGLCVVDISDPADPQEVGFHDMFGSASEIHVLGNYLYFGLHVIDISDLSNPREVGFCQTPGEVLGVHISGGYAYVANGWGGLRVIDMSDPLNPQEVGSYDVLDAAMDVHVSGNYAYVADGGGSIYELAEISDFGSTEIDVAGFWVVDISNPSAPQEVGLYQTPADARGVHVSGGYAYVATDRVTSYWANDEPACLDGGLWVVDISDPSNPREVGSCDMPEPALGVYVSGGYAYVADYKAGLRVVDISTPAAPREVGFCDIPGDAWGVCISGSHAYVAQSIGTPPILNGGLRVIDISDPTNPREVGFCDMPDPAGGVHVSGGYAYVATGWDGLRVVDISDPSNPQKVGFYDTPSCAGNVYVSGDYAYVVCGCGSGVLLVLDITNPSAPQEVARYDTYGGAENVHVSGGYVYVADRLGGLLIFRHADAYTTAVTPTDKNLVTWADLKMTKVFQNYPNPFNPETWIPFELVQESEVILRIYDAKGSLIREISLGRKQAGSYIQRSKAVYWDGRNDGGDRVASGVYFYHFQAGGYMATRKMILAE